MNYNTIKEFPAYFRNLITGELLCLNKDKSIEAVRCRNTDDQSVIRFRMIKPSTVDACIDNIMKYVSPVEAAEFENLKNQAKNFINHI